MDQWLKIGIVSKRKTTELTNPIPTTQDMPSYSTSFAEENPCKKLPQVNDIKVLVPETILNFKKLEKLL